MSVIENKYWQGEPLKAVIKFDENTEYMIKMIPYHQQIQNLHYMEK